MTYGLVTAVCWINQNHRNRSNSDSAPSVSVVRAPSIENCPPDRLVLNFPVVKYRENTTENDSHRISTAEFGLNLDVTMGIRRLKLVYFTLSIAHWIRRLLPVNP